MSAPEIKIAPRAPAPSSTSKEVLASQATNELVFAVVGHVGSGTSIIGRTIETLLKDTTLDGRKFDVSYLKAKEVIVAWANKTGQPNIPVIHPTEKDLKVAIQLQDLGDKMRLASGDFTGVARSLVRLIKAERAKKHGKPIEELFVPDGLPRAYVIDSIRNPAELEFLRTVYQNAFILIGVVCEENVRLARLTKKYKNAGEDDAKDFMKRDAKAVVKYGQRVSDAFHLADYFLDNTESRFKDKEGKVANPDWDINEQLKRLIKIVSGAKDVVPPTIHETAMHVAYGAQMQSACLSRQVGAALVDNRGNVAATGTNEVPQAGGGVYGEGFIPDAADHRCAFRDEKYCSNTREHNKIIDQAIKDIPELEKISDIRDKLKESGIGQLLEFSRAVHAEMDAILTAGREGTSTYGTRLYVTTFPCHYCARHIVASGIDEVQFIEPYPKSQALSLHSDSITLDPKGWKAPSDGGGTVLFRPFTGVAPRLFHRAFLKNRELKNSKTGNIQFGLPDWGSSWFLGKASYLQVEAELVKE